MASLFFTFAKYQIISFSAAVLFSNISTSLIATVAFIFETETNTLLAMERMYLIELIEGVLTYNFRMR